MIVTAAILLVLVILAVLVWRSTKADWDSEYGACTGDCQQGRLPCNCPRGMR